MGYCISIEDADFVIPADKLNDAYVAMCELNKHDELKRGGSYENGEKINSWFAWMDSDYPSKCFTAEEILAALGFECSINDNGDLSIVGYNSKMGDEKHFLKAIAPFVKEGSYLVWRGEDGSDWRNEFRNGKMITMEAEVTWKEVNDE